MSLSPETRARIDSILAANHVVLFMKGEPRAPQCGFSAKAVGILGGLLGWRLWRRLERRRGLQASGTSMRS